VRGSELVQGSNGSVNLQWYTYPRLKTAVLNNMGASTPHNSMGLEAGYKHTFLFSYLLPLETAIALVLITAVIVTTAW
jgi:hypothetical protein